MSARAGITKAYKDRLKEKLNGTGYFVTDIQGNVDSKTRHINNINDFPFISVTPGPETRDNLPSRQTFANLTLYIRIYVKNEEEPQEELEQIMADLETFIDTNQQIVYNVTTPEGVLEGRTISSDIASIATDEGLLSPIGFGEIAVSIQYEKTRIM